ncbi:MAG: ABC transporter substrate-binding protein [Thermoplasmata archaeon]
MEKKKLYYIISIIVAVILVVSVISIVTSPKSSQPKPSSAKDSLTVEEGSYPDSLDPAVTYSTPGWEIVEQVYQGLVAPNGTSVTSFVGVLAQNWTISADNMNYTFYLWKNITFSNGDPCNAYAVWYSIYRTIIMDQAPAWILTQNLVAGNGINFNITAQILNNISLSYTNPTSQDLYYMEYPNQSVQVVNPYELIMHVGYGYNGDRPYNAFMMTLTTPMAYVVDPLVVENHGGVVAGQPNSWMESNAIGTSFYTLYSVIPGQGITLQESQNYWAKNLPSSDLNYAIQPPYLKYIIFNYKATEARISDLQSGSAQIIEAPVTDYSYLKGISGITVSILPVAFGSSQGAYYVYMDPYAFSAFQNLSVRMAITYAIDYKGIISAVFSGLATQWIGPIPPGFPYYNQTTNGLVPYQQNLTLAAMYLAQAGYQAKLPNGTVLNKNGPTFPKVNFLYNSDSDTETSASEIIQSNLAQIGINIQLTPLTFSSYEAAVWSTSTNLTQYPMGLNFYTEDYTASIDYVSALAIGDYVGSSGYFNNTVYNWTVNASTSSNENAVIQNLTNITHTMYNQYVIDWVYTPYLLSITENGVTGMIPNPAGSGAGYFMFYNTIHYTT